MYKKISEIKIVQNICKSEIKVAHLSKQNENNKVMKLEAGKKYITKGGSIVTINYNTDELGHPKHIQPFGGVIEGRGSAFYCENGIYNLNNPDSEYNIIKEME